MYGGRKLRSARVRRASLGASSNRYRRGYADHLRHGLFLKYGCGQFALPVHDKTACCAMGERAGRHPLPNSRGTAPTIIEPGIARNPRCNCISVGSAGMVRVFNTCFSAEWEDDHGGSSLHSDVFRTIVRTLLRLPDDRPYTPTSSRLSAHNGTQYPGDVYPLWLSTYTAVIDILPATLTVVEEDITTFVLWL